MTESRPGMPLHVKSFIGLALGAIAGIVCQSALGLDDPNVKWFAENIARPVGKIFLNMIFMIVVPLLFSALVLGVSQIGDARKVGRVGALALLMTVILSGIAVGIGLTAVNLVKPGEGITVEQRDRLMQQYGDPADAAKKAEKAKEAKGVADTIVEFVPDNPLNSAVNALTGGLIAFMFFALVFGLALAAVDPEKAQPVKQLMEGLFAVSLKVIDFAMRIAPYGVFGLAFTAASALGFAALAALGKYAILVLVALAFHQFVVFSLAIRFVACRSPLQFFRQIRTVMLTAFATSSSNATLPTALKASEDEVGNPPDVSRFVLTVGATANQNGTALFDGITVLFLAQLYGVNLDLSGQITVMLLAILAGVGTAGVPGGSWPMIAVILVKIGVPAEAIGICLGIDRVLDMSRTVLNVSGDITIATCVSKLMGKRTAIAGQAAG